MLTVVTDRRFSTGVMLCRSKKLKEKKTKQEKSEFVLGNDWFCITTRDEAEQQATCRLF